jgi:predicted N-formylglutamate amidohydrolase
MGRGTPDGVLSWHGDPAAGGPLLVICEHAGNQVPSPLRLDPADRRWLFTHWGYDIGIAEVARVLIDTFGGAGLFAEFSRLVCDPNRPWDDRSCILDQIEGTKLRLNQGLDAAARQLRKVVFYDRYHDAVDALLRRRREIATDFTLVALHSFTERLGDEVRWMEAGVLFDDDQRGLGEAMAAEVAREGLTTAINEPYSGIDGFTYSVTRHGRAHGLPHVEIELRQDLIATPEQSRQMAGRLAPALARGLVHGIKSGEMEER